VLFLKPNRVADLLPLNLISFNVVPSAVSL